MTIYEIKLDNYEGETTFELYITETGARARMYDLIQEAKDKNEFDYQEDDDVLSFFDPNYNEFSTYITLRKTTLESLFMDLT